MKMKHLVLGCLFFLILNSAALSQKKDAVMRSIAVKSDKNIIIENDPTLAASKTDQCFIIDGNESKGYMEIEFEGVNASKTALLLTLVINCADVEYAETAEGLSVFMGSQKVGSIALINRNARVEIPLDKSLLKSLNSFTLTLKANGEDGLYLLSKKSGFGSFLLITY